MLVGSQRPRSTGETRQQESTALARQWITSTPTLPAPCPSTGQLFIQTGHSSQGECKQFNCQHPPGPRKQNGLNQTRQGWLAVIGLGSHRPLQPHRAAPDPGEASAPQPSFTLEQDAAVQASGPGRHTAWQYTKCLSAPSQQSRKLPLEALPHIPPLLRKRPGLALTVPRNVESSTQAGPHASRSSVLSENLLWTEHAKGINPPGAQNRTFLPLAALCSLPPFLTFRNIDYVFLIRIEFSKEPGKQHFFPLGQQQLLYQHRHKGERFWNPHARRVKSVLHWP